MLKQLECGFATLANKEEASTPIYQMQQFGKAGVRYVGAINERVHVRIALRHAQRVHIKSNRGVHLSKAKGADNETTN